MGLNYGKLGRYREAIDHLKQAIRIEPDLAEAHCDLGVVYHGIGRYQEAIEAIKQAIRIKPDFARAHYNLGLLYFLVGNKGSALEEYGVLKTLDHDLANQLFNKIYK